MGSNPCLLSRTPFPLRPYLITVLFIFKPFLLLPPFEEVKGPFSKVNGGYVDGHVHDSFKKVFLYVFFWGFVPIFTLHILHIVV